jgi:hypothetical protein
MAELSPLANFCEQYCPICTRSRRKGSRLSKGFVKFTTEFALFAGPEKGKQERNRMKPVN